MAARSSRLETSAPTGEMGVHAVGVRIHSDVVFDGFQFAAGVQAEAEIACFLVKVVVPVVRLQKCADHGCNLARVIPFTHIGILLILHSVSFRLRWLLQGVEL